MAITTTENRREAGTPCQVAANMKIGNDKAFLFAAISQCLPYIGCPRSLNALRCANDAANQFE